ncbi:MAG: histidine phosphatase family protein [Coriobacteriaceae bacterium]|nr:histidine phosphatase family protein [Coriobacteriaceae bacterium]
MSRLYLMRHGQTEYNLAKKVQGRCDSPLTDLGRKQAQAGAEWLLEQGVTIDRAYTSPLGRAHDTAKQVCARLHAAHLYSGGEPRVCEGIQERSYGSLEEGPAAAVPLSVWDPREEIVAYGGEGSDELRARMVKTLTSCMEESLSAGCSNVLALSHGSATLQFKTAWEHTALCSQDVPLGNCCILVFEYDEASKTFSNTCIHNPL